MLITNNSTNARTILRLNYGYRMLVIKRNCFKRGGDKLTWV